VLLVVTILLAVSRPPRSSLVTEACRPWVMESSDTMAAIPMATPSEERPEVKQVTAVPEKKPAPEQREAGSPGAAGSPDSAADKAPQTDSESDPFSMQGSAEFRPGKVVSHFGRKIKTVRPRLTLAGQYDLFTVNSPSVVLQVRADDDGTVREVKVIRSSGSREVDQPCVLAMYDWWFEPPRDAQGKPRASEMIWTLSFYVR
jgi:TonB family protein